jgi:hypothetical protein
MPGYNGHGACIDDDVFSDYWVFHRVVLFRDCEHDDEKGGDDERGDPEWGQYPPPGPCDHVTEFQNDEY